MAYHDAAGIIFDMLKDYPRCSTCKQPATRRIEHALLIIGEQPRACDDDTHIPEVRDPSLVKFTELPQAELVRAAIKYLLSFQRPGGGFRSIDGHWKETGAALWTIVRHGELTADAEWLRSTWPACGACDTGLEL